MAFNYEEVSAAYVAEVKELAKKWRREQNPAETNQLFGQMLGMVRAAELFNMEPNPLVKQLKEIINAEWDY